MKDDRAFTGAATRFMLPMRVKMKWSLHLLSLAALLLAALPSSAFVVNSNPSGQTRHWPLSMTNPDVSTNTVNPSTKSIRYFLSGDAFSKAQAEAELNAIRASFDQWQSVPGTALKFEEAGVVSGGVDVNVSNGMNVVFWAKQSTLVNGGFDDISGTLSVTYHRVTAENVIQEADIVLNGVQFQWFTDLNSRTTEEQFIESTVLHEIGHFIGLDHSPVGGATLFARGSPGVDAQAGLSGDEIAAARALYPMTNQLSRLGAIQGRVIMNGSGVFGACLIVEDAAGNVVSGTVTRSDGRYELPALTPGDYQIRVSPLDPAVANRLARLISGPDIAPGFASAETGFSESPARDVRVVAQVTTSIDFSVAKASPAIRITRIKPISLETDPAVAMNAPASIRVGTSNRVIGVYAPDFPADGAALSVSGAGITLGPSKFTADVFPGSRPSLHMISAPISVDRDAVPGLRSLVVRQGTNVAFANGFLEILPAFPDDNFDGLDDAFQRRYFPRFTQPEAAPAADPDGDGLANADEYSAGTNPTNRLSVLRIDRVSWISVGSVIIWESVPAKRYQLFGRAGFGTGAWEPVGAPVIATGLTMQFLDSSTMNAVRFYRVHVLP